MIRHVPISDAENRRSDAARTARPAATAPAAPTKIRDIFLARLSDLEERVGRELGAARPSLGPAGEYAMDLTRGAWRAGASLLSSLGSVTGRRELLASWTAGDQVDELGFDPALAEAVREVVRPFARRWLGLADSRSTPLPERGGVLVLLNRSGSPVPVEALLLQAYLESRAGSRAVAVLWEPDLPELPWISDFLRKIGVVAATYDNALALLERGAVVLAFPEGRAARSKTYDRRYRLARFESAEVLHAAIEAGARIVAGAVVGNEDSYPVLGHIGSTPITAQFPLLGIVGLLPLPIRWTVRLGPALEHGLSAGDGAGVAAVADAARARMQACLGELLAGN